MAVFVRLVFKISLTWTTVTILLQYFEVYDTMISLISSQFFFSFHIIYEHFSITPYGHIRVLYNGV